MHKKIDSAYNNHKKTFNRSVRLDKSPSTKNDKENLKIEHREKTDRKFKLATEHRVETDRRSMQKST